MATKKKTEEVTIESKVIAQICNFFSFNKKILAIAGAALVAVLLVVVIVSSISKSNSDKALIKVASLEQELVKAVAEGSEIDSELASKFAAEVKDKSFASMKAQYLVAQIASINEDFDKAYDEFIKCYNIDSNQYLAKLSLMNAAVCKDNLGEYEVAMDLYNKVVDSDELGLAARALFNIGRIYYQDNNMELAKAAFEQLISNYPGSEYTAIAKNIVNVM